MTLSDRTPSRTRGEPRTPTWEKERREREREERERRGGEEKVGEREEKRGKNEKYISTVIKILECSE